MDTNETSAGEFYYFHGAMGTKHPQIESFTALTEALDFAAAWAEERQRPPSNAAFWQIEYVRDTTGVVMVANSNPELCKVGLPEQQIICGAEDYPDDGSLGKSYMMQARRWLLDDLIIKYGVYETEPDTD